MNRENLKKIVEKLSECAVEGKLEHSRDQLKKLSDRIAEDEIIIAVLSQFKRGKSTFVNFILGEDILPTGVIPITSIVTKIKYGSEKYAVVARENGEKIDVGLNELITYVSEQQNSNNEKGIAEVQIYIPQIF
ncbi:MAG: dynamin family protein [Caulobacteraceae bacterium]